MIACDVCSTEFEPYRPNGKRCSDECRTAAKRTQSREWALANPGRVAQRIVDWRAANPEARKIIAARQNAAIGPDVRREKALVATYGITGDEYDQLLEFQGGRCAVCDKPPQAGKRLVVDHDHYTGFVRGLLHGFPCNYQFIGRHRDPDIFARAADYLRTPPAVTLLGERKGQPKTRKRR